MDEWTDGHVESGRAVKTTEFLTKGLILEKHNKLFCLRALLPGLR